jgi:MFS family permease
MFLEYAVWAAWAPVLATRLLGPLKMTGKQTGWIYATLPLSCIIVPLIAGHAADVWLDAKWILVAAHLIGAVLLFLAVNQTTFWRLFGVMLCYSMCYAATMPLVNAVLFDMVPSHKYTQKLVFIWAPVAWALVGWFLSAWRWIFKTEGEGKDCLCMAGLLSVVMGLSCLFLPGKQPACGEETPVAAQQKEGQPAETTQPAGDEESPIVRSLSMLKRPDFLAFVLISLVAAGMMQFYFLGSARFMQDVGIPLKSASGVMAIAQAAQAIATLFLFDVCVDNLGFKWTMTIGATGWLLLYAIYVATKPRWLIVVGQSLHGLAYVLFIIVGQTYVNEVSPKAIAGTMQALIFAATVGVGVFLGTNLAGVVLDWGCVNGKFQWRRIWLVPGAIILASVVAMAIFFRAEKDVHEAEPEASCPQACHVVESV